MQKKHMMIIGGVVAGAACIGIIAGLISAKHDKELVELPTEGYEVEVREPVEEIAPIETYKRTGDLVQTKYIQFSLPEGKGNDYDFVFYDAYNDFNDDRAEFADLIGEDTDPIHPIHVALSLYDKKLHEDGYSGRLMDIHVSSEEPIEGTEIVGLVRSESTGEEYFLYVTYPKEESGSALADENANIAASLSGYETYYVVPYDFAQIEMERELKVQVAEITDEFVFIITDDDQSAIIQLDAAQLMALEAGSYYLMHYTGEWHDGYLAQNDISIVNFEKIGGDLTDLSDLQIGSSEEDVNPYGYVDPYVAAQQAAEPILNADGTPVGIVPESAASAADDAEAAAEAPAEATAEASADPAPAN